jgi:predicted DNA binding CopG/RHH family protein
MAHEKKTVPKFRSEAEEREFWRKHDSSEYLSWENARPAVFSRLRPSTRAISIRLPESLLAELRALANKIDIPYQSLIKMFLSEKVKENLNKVLSKSHH